MESLKIKPLLPTVEITLEKGSQELISELKEHKLILKNIEQQNSVIVHLHKRSYYNNLLTVLNNYEIIKIKEMEHPLEDLFLK